MAKRLVKLNNFEQIKTKRYMAKWQWKRLKEKAKK